MYNGLFSCICDNIFDFSNPEKHVYLGCSNSSLELIKINGGGHQWPGIPTLIGGLGNINMDFYSPEIIWEFLDGKSCPELINNVLEVELKKEKKIIKIIDLLGRETKLKKNTIQIILYDDGSVQKVFSTQ